MKKSRYIYLMLVLLLLATLACGTGDGEEPTAAPADSPTTAPQADTPTEAPQVDPPPTDVPADPPTQAPPPTEVPATRATLPTKEPPPPPPPGPSLQLSAAPFEHPNGLIDIFYPNGWSPDSSTGGATFAAPDDSGFINVETTNTALTLDGASFERFLDAREANFFNRRFDGYEVINRQVDTSIGLARVTKRLLFNGSPQVVMTLYDQHNDVIYSLDFWADADVAPAYQEVYEEIISTATVYSTTAAQNVDKYLYIYTFDGPGNLFSIEVPTPWRYETDIGDVAVVDTFYSPDEHAIIQNITYDDGTEISRSLAGAFALELLRSYYATDLVITDDQVQSDGSERLTWYSPGGNYSGISFLETRGTTFLLFSILWDDPYENDYFSVLEYTVGSYEVP